MELVPYRRDTAIAYAERWALGRNPDYYDFDSLGGDCTNFVSQCIHAGGMPMHFGESAGWFYLSLSQRSPSWTSVEYLYRFLISNRSVGPFARTVQPTALEPGDVIQLGKEDGVFYHSLLVLDPSPYRIYVAAHTVDSLWRPLDTYRYASLRCLHIEGGRQ